MLPAEHLAAGHEPHRDEQRCRSWSRRRARAPGASAAGRPCGAVDHTVVWSGRMAVCAAPGQGAGPRRRRRAASPSRALERCSIRQVAARASVSIGAVQHHYPTKDALLAAAMGHVEVAYRERLARSTADTAGPDERLRLTVHAPVPDGAEDRTATALWVAFGGRAAVHGPTAEDHRRLWQRAEDVLTARGRGPGRGPSARRGGRRRPACSAWPRPVGVGAARAGPHGRAARPPPARRRRRRRGQAGAAAGLSRAAVPGRA